ncbi:MAG: glutamine amidotransferase [Acidimicrobiales bacterium]
MSGPRSSRLTIAVVYPDLLGTYGDGGNAMVLAKRAQWRGIDVELVQAPSDRALPEADLYTIGGGEDGPQVRAATSLIDDGTLARRVAEGAVVLGVCAGFQLLGRSFPDGTDRPRAGLGLLDLTTRKGTGARAVGELVATPAPDAPRTARGDRLPRLTGFENHGGVTTVGPGARVLATVERGVGNGGGGGGEGAWSGRVLGTYLHGPVLARNTALADLLLGWALAPADSPAGTAAILEPIDDFEELALRSERLEAVDAPGGTGWRARVARAMAR